MNRVNRKTKMIIKSQVMEISKTLPVTVYTPQSDLRDLRTLFGDMWRDLCASRELAWRLFVRNITAGYRQTFMGYFWAIMPPLGTTGLWVYLNSQKVLTVQQPDIPYPIYVLTGTVLWSTFVEALHSPMGMVNESRGMLAKVNFPREALLLTGFYQVVWSLLIRIVILGGVFLCYGVVPTMPVLLVAVVCTFGMILFGMMLGLLLTPVSLLFGDIGHALAGAAQIWMYLTPVVYVAPQSGLAATLCRWNPMTHLLVMTRDLLTMGTLTHWEPSLVILSATMAMLLVGWVLYRIAMPHLIERFCA